MAGRLGFRLWLRSVFEGFGRPGAALPAPRGPVPAGGPGRRRSRVLAAVLLITAGLVLAAGLSAAHLLGPVGPSSDESVITVIPYGYGTAQIAEQLHELGLIRSSAAFKAWAVLTRRAGTLRAGEYSIAYSLTTPQIIDQLAQGRVVLHPVTLPEGYNVAQISAVLQARGFAQADGFQAALSAAASSGLLPEGWLPEDESLVRQSLEGYLFPDTYNFYRGITAEETVRAMVGRLKAAVPPDLEERAAELGMSVSEVLTLASIIEREAVRPEEREIISGVYHNRLRVGMKLEACPTVRYVMPDPLGPITDRERAIDSPYNTYLYPGLPPGPICSAGLASIEAALSPAEVNYYYFVAKPDGTHAFARTFSEHEANIRKYR